MGIKQRILVVAIVLALVFGSLIGIYMYMSYYRVDTSTIEYIEQFQTGKYIFNDLANDIGVESIDDIGYKVNGDYAINIYYGKQIIEMNQACFKSDKFREALGKIGIKVLTHEDEDGTILYKVTSWDDEVKEYSTVE